MNTASSLLQSIIPTPTEEELTTLVIDHDLRVINIPSGIKVLGVASDDEVLRLNFKIPRYISITDLSEFSLRINYCNSKNEGDVYTITDSVVGDEYITFSWLVGPIATRYKGTTKFNISAIKLDEDGNVDREYNTTPASLDVLEGLEPNYEAVSMYSDIIEQWRQLLFTHGNNVMIDDVTGVAYAIRISNGQIVLDEVNVP